MVTMAVITAADGDTLTVEALNDAKAYQIHASEIPAHCGELEGMRGVPVHVT